MSLRNFFCGVIAAAMIFSASTLCTAADESATDKLTQIEIDTYGYEQIGAMLDRISRLEKTYTGQNATGNMNARIDAIYKILYDNSEQPCVLAKVNALEWNINHRVESGGVEKRLVALETAILGRMSEGNFNARIRTLAKSSFGEEILPIAQVQIPANTLIKVETLVPANSKTMQPGDSIPFRVVEDIFVDGKLVFTQGLTGQGTVVNVHRARNIMSNGKIETDFHTLRTIDGQNAATYTGVEALEEMKAQELARGLSLVGHTFSGKTAGVEEVFMRGKNIDVPAGVVLYVQTRDPITVYGVTTSGGISIADVVTQPTQNVEQPRPVAEQTFEQPTQPVAEPVAQPTQPTATQPKPPVTQGKPPVTGSNQSVEQPRPSSENPEGLSDDEKVAVAPTPPPPAPKPEPKPESKPAPRPVPEDVEIIEVYDEA